MAKKNYTPLPAVSPEVAVRYQTVLEVMAGTLTVSEGARKLGLSRNHFQSLMHRAMGSMVDQLTPNAGGRPPMPEAERKLKAQTERLQAENARLKQQAERTNHMLGVASLLLKGRLGRGKRRERAPRDDKKSTEEE